MAGLFGSSLLFGRRDDPVFAFFVPLIPYLSLDLTSTPGGVYYFNAFWVGNSLGASSIRNSFLIDNNTFYTKISGRGNPSGADQTNSLQRQLIIPAGSLTLDMSFNNSGGGTGGGAFMEQGRMTIWRVA
jgi:hypothetical protein